MPDIETKRIDELPVATDVGDSDLFVIEQSGVAKSIEGSVLRSNFSQEVDGTLSATSENPVQNKVIKAALDGKITTPSSPTAGQFLVYNGSAWVAQTVPNASGVSF